MGKVKCAGLPASSTTWVHVRNAMNKRVEVTTCDKVIDKYGNEELLDIFRNPFNSCEWVVKVWM